MSRNSKNLNLNGPNSQNFYPKGQQLNTFKKKPLSSLVRFCSSLDWSSVVREADLLKMLCHVEAQVCLAKDLHVAAPLRLWHSTWTWAHEHFSEKARNFIVSKIQMSPKSSYPLAYLSWSFVRKPIQLQRQFPKYESSLSETKVELISSGRYENRESTCLEKNSVQ